MTIKIEHTVKLVGDEEFIIEHESKEAAAFWLLGAQQLGYIEIGSRIYPWHSVLMIHKKIRRS